MLMQPTREIGMLFSARLTTAEILYHLPDHPSFLQSFVWQHMDTAPSYPRLKKFLDFWVENIDGKLHTVTVSHAGLATPQEFSYADAEIRMH